jgi:peptide/nickel transport system substrate-binding protein
VKRAVLNNRWIRYLSGGIILSLLALAIPATASGAGSVARDASKKSPVSGTLKGAISSGGIDSLDPDRWYFALTWGLANALCTPLLRYATKPGAGGTKLVPGTANLPVVSNHGLVYTYTIRTGARFSDGKPITPADIKYSFMRMMNPKVDTGSGGDFAKVIGAPTYMAGKTTTIPGIVTKGKTVSFHLTQPDGALEYATAMATTCPVPAGTPMQPITNGSLLKTYASGPYKIQTYDPARQLVLVYNKNYDRALGARGHVAKIVFAIGVDSQSAIEEIQAGQLDINTTNVDTATIIRLSNDPAVSSQIHDSVRPAIFYIFLNYQTPPLTNVDVRKAINYAITRTEILKEWGGPLAGTPTDQITPPSFASYKKFTIYPNTSDLSKAKALMAQSGVKTPVTLGLRVLNTAPGNVTMAEVIKANLAPIGITVDVEGTPNSVNYTYISNYKSHTPMGIEEFSGTFPDDSSVVGALFNPATPDSTANFSRFADTAFLPTFTRAFNAVGKAGITDWQKLDYRLMAQQAPGAPLLNPKWFDFVSARLGGYVFSQAVTAINYNTLYIKK